MKFSTLILAILMGLSTQGYGQTNFDIYGFTYRYGPAALAYFKAHDVKLANLMTQSVITDPLNPKNDTTIHAANIAKYLLKTYPDANATGVLVLNWETEVFKHLRDYPVTHSRYKYAEGQWRALIQEVRKHRPRLSIGVYAIPFKVWGSWQKINYNLPGKYDNLLALTDFIAPSVYIQFADEEVGHARNLQFLQDNLDIAFTIGKRLNKPVYPFLWHRVHPTNVKYPAALIQTDVLAKYVKYIATYSFNNYKASGLFMWEAIGQRTNPTTLAGINNWLQGSVYDAATYEALMIRNVAAFLNVTNNL